MFTCMCGMDTARAKCVFKVKKRALKGSNPCFSDF